MERHITLPLTEELAKSLHAGDTVYLTGTIYTSRDAGHKRMCEALARGEELPFDPKDATIYYVGPTPAKPGQVIGSAGPTTSGRMDAYAPTMMSVGARGMIGKGARLPEVVEAMLPYFTEKFGNPSSVYSFAAANKEVINQQRDAIAEMIGAKSNEIYFTGGGSESDNWALKCTAEAYANKGNHIITTKIEHHAILHTAEYLEKRGFEVTYLDVDEDGKVKLDDLKAAIRPTTILISVMFANNEIGTIQPIKEIGEIAHEHGILFHTDAVQAFGQLPINVDECHIDMLSASGHKFNGPKGIGIMYIRTGVKIRSFIHGGAQERKRRAGTENVPGIVGIGTAAKRAAANMEERTAKEREVRDYLIDRVLNEIPYCRLNGHRTDRLPNNANFSFQFVEGESLLIKLDMKGICGSSGSACTSGSLDPSHVLLAIGLPHEIAHGSLRLTLNEEIEKEDIDYVVDNLKEIVAHLREMSPLYEDFIKKQKKQGEK